MPDAKSSPSDQDSQSGSLQSVKDAGIGQFQRAKRIYHTKKSPTQALATMGIVSGLAILFPLPFTIAGVLAVTDDALNLTDDREDLKKFLKEAVEAVGKKTAAAEGTDGTPVAPAPAAG